MTEVWGCEKDGIWAESKGGKDGKEGVVWFGIEMAVTVKIEENKTIILYGKDWEQYFQHKNYTGFTELVASSEVKLQATKENTSKQVRAKEGRKDLPGGTRAGRAHAPSSGGEN